MTYVTGNNSWFPFFFKTCSFPPIFEGGNQVNSARWSMCIWYIDNIRSVHNWHVLQWLKLNLTEISGSTFTTKGFQMLPLSFIKIVRHLHFSSLHHFRNLLMLSRPDISGHLNLAWSYMDATTFHQRINIWKLPLSYVTATLLSDTDPYHPWHFVYICAACAESWYLIFFTAPPF